MKALLRPWAEILRKVQCRIGLSLQGDMDKQVIMQYDVFNGDADGIFALQQLRLAEPIPEAILVTGVKRDINLLRRIEDITSAAVTVLDISLDKNRDALQKILQSSNRVLYIDHHFAGDIPDSPLIRCHIEPSPHTCTSLLVNDLLAGKYSAWAICGAFGDNLHQIACQRAAEAGFSTTQRELLSTMGELFNYNGYGTRVEDLHFHPAQLYRAISAFEDPFDFHHTTDVIEQLRDGYRNDMARAAAADTHAIRGRNRVYIFPAEPWARRIVGVFSNLKAREEENAAHAVIIENDDNSLQISVRAPLTTKRDADMLCRQYPTGGGRAAAAGINALPAAMLDDFLENFAKVFN